MPFRPEKLLFQTINLFPVTVTNVTVANLTVAAYILNLNE